MTVTLDALAQNTMDLYYGAEKSEDDFLGIYHFKFVCAAFYHAFVQDEWEKSYALNRADGKNEGAVNTEYYVPEIAAVDWSAAGNTHKVQLKNGVMSFRYDQTGMGILDVSPVGPGGRLVRTTLRERYKNTLLPHTSVSYWYPVQGNTLYIEQAADHPFKEVLVYYIPDIEVKEDEQPDATLPMSLVAMILKTVPLLFKGVAQGTVVDMTQDGNPNKVLQTEIANAIKQAFAGGAK